MATVPTSRQVHRPHWLTAGLLIMILVAFAKTTWTLGAQSLWWDESLSLQRAESSLIPLLLNTILLTDSQTQVATTEPASILLFPIAGDDLAARWQR